MFTAGVTQSDDEMVDTLFGEKTPGADDLIAGKKKADEGQDDDLDPDLDPEAQRAIQAAKKLPGKKKQEPIKKTDDLSDEEMVDNLFPGEEELDPNDPDFEKKSADKKAAELAAKQKAAPKKTTTPPENTEADFEAVYKHFVAEKIWGEVEVPDDFVWDAEGFKQIQALQSKSQYEDLLDRTGTYGKAIIEYEKNGGNPAELLGLFREQKEVREFDISDKPGQEEFLRSYLEAQGNSEKSIERTIKALTDQGDDALKEEADEKKALWDSQYKEEIENTQKEQQLRAKQMEDEVKNFQKNIISALTSDADITPKEKRELKDYVLDYSQNLQGRQVSQFYLDMLEIQKKPADYLELAKFIKGLKTGDYRKKIEDKTKKQVSAQSFLKIKNSTALKGSGGSNIDLDNNQQEPGFLSYLKRK